MKLTFPNLEPKESFTRKGIYYEDIADKSPYWQNMNLWEITEEAIQNYKGRILNLACNIIDLTTLSASFKIVDYLSN